jgi:hypothetical protein
MKKNSLFFKQSVLVIVLLFTISLHAQSYNTTFRHGDDSWTAGYTGIPSHLDDDGVVKVEWKEMDNSKGNYSISFEGKSKSKKTFLYIYRQFIGLKPNSTYGIVFNVQFLSSLQNGSIYIKVGALSHQPVTFDLPLTDSNFQKGKIGYDSKDLEVLGIIYPSYGTSDAALYRSQQMQNYAKPFYANTDKDGSLWLIIGVEPEATVKEIKPILLNTMRILFQYQEVYLPTPSDENSETERIDSEFNDDITSIEIYTGSGHLLKAIYSIDGIFTGSITVDEFESGRYFFLFNLANGAKIVRSVEI